MIKEAIKRPFKWMLSIILLPFKLLLSLVGKVISIVVSLIVFSLILYGALAYMGYIPESIGIQTLLELL